MGKVVKRAYKYRFYPTREQAGLLNRTFGCVRLVYNRALAERTRICATEHRATTYVESSGWLTEWKASDELGFLNEVSCVPLQQTLRHLQGGFAAFFAKRARYPRFKSKRKSCASAEFTRSAFRFRGGQLTLAKMTEPLDIRWSRPLPGGAQPSTVTVSRDAAGRWFVSLLVETSIEPLAPCDRSVGVDAGLNSLVSLSTGEKVTNPRHERRYRRKLAKAQRALSRKQKGSANRAKARLRVARVHARVADRRRDHLHKLSTRLVRENQTVVIEDLTIRNMIKKPCGGACHVGCQLVAVAIDAGVQSRLVWPGSAAGGPLVSVVEDLLRMRSGHGLDAAQRPELDLHLWCSPRPGRQRGP